MNKKQKFLEKYFAMAQEAGAAFKLNPAVILAQAAIESGWGESALSKECNNFFGITGYGPPTAYIGTAKRRRFRASALSLGFMPTRGRVLWIMPASSGVTIPAQRT